MDLSALLISILTVAITKFPILSSVFMVMGVMRAAFKPLMSLIETVVAATPTKADDEVLTEVKASKVYTSIVWLVDYFASVKIPVAAAAVAPAQPAAAPNVDSKAS